VGRKIRCSQTHGAIEALIEGIDFLSGLRAPDIVFSARRMSPDEKKLLESYADHGEKFTIIETPIALDALVFIGHKDVSVAGLTHEQIESIYTAETKNWSEVGGTDEAIVPFVRNANSGSQELMESLVMTQPIPPGFYEEHYEDFQQIGGMFPMLTEVEDTPGGLGYTVYYYLNKIVPEDIRGRLKMMAVNSVAPNKGTIANRTYPFAAEVYMMIRSDLDKQSAAYKVYEFMQTGAGKEIIARSGYVPYEK
jgi:phosphate transport system substrate-binding protein